MEGGLLVKWRSAEGMGGLRVTGCHGKSREMPRGLFPKVTGSQGHTPCPSVKRYRWLGTGRRLMSFRARVLDIQERTQVQRSSGQEVTAEPAVLGAWRGLYQNDLEVSASLRLVLEIGPGVCVAGEGLPVVFLAGGHLPPPVSGRDGRFIHFNIVSRRSTNSAKRTPTTSALAIVLCCCGCCFNCLIFYYHRANASFWKILLNVDVLYTSMTNLL